MMRYLRLLLSFFVLFSLAACGGGGGSAGVPGGSANPSNFKVNAPSSVTLALGQSASYSITGGPSPYAAVSSSPNVALALVDGEKITIAATSVGSAVVRVTPSIGGTAYDIAVTVISSTKLFQVQAPGTINLLPGNINSYVIDGGVPPYRVESASPGVVSAAVVGGSVRIEAKGVGTADVVVFDAGSSAPVTLKVEVGTGQTAELFTTAPSELTMAPRTIRTFTIGGGVAPYSAQSNNLAAVVGVVEGVNLSLTSAADGAASVLVTDARGNRVTIAVTVSTGAMTDLFTTAPPALTLAPSATRSFAVGGGVAPYRAQSSNLGAAKAKVEGADLIIESVADGSANVVVTDARGTRVTVAVTVTSGTPADLFTTAPAALTMAPNSTRVFAVGGGVAPYVAFSSNSNVVTAGAAGAVLTLTTPVGAIGTANVVVTDAVGKTVVLVVTASSAAQPLTLSPDAITIPVDLPGGALIRIIGGSAPFTVTSGIPSALSASVVSTVAGGVTTYEVALTPKLVAGVDVTVVDSAGQSAKVTVTINAGTPGLRLSVSALTISERDVNRVIDFGVYGAVGAIRVFSSDLKRASVAAIAGPTVRVTTAALLGDLDVPTLPGTAVITITVVDSLNNVATAVLTVVDNP